jgi:biopolymer transport protein ExbB
VVVVILMVMAVVSWIVMVQKTSFVSRQAAANRRFRLAFEDIEGDLGELSRRPADQLLERSDRLPAAGARSLRDSSLYRLYRIGADGIRARVSGAETGEAPADQAVPASVLVLEPHSIAALRARLDAGLVRETQRLNSQLVLLTIAISGGPFLGLLGTVVGVMITFAAVAAAGDVNVNAIAPGIAAALIATVAGLAVAIPALFGYNYLITRVKDITADLRVFIDEFITNVAEVYRDIDDRDRRKLAAE